MTNATVCQKSQLKLAIAGLGAIGMQVARRVDRGDVSGVTLTAVSARDLERAARRVSAATYEPDSAAADAYDDLYTEYHRLHEYFGEGGNDVMHRLRDIRRQAVSR